MPIYEYRCQQGHTFEVMQRMSDDPVQTCETCEAPVQRVFHAPAVHFKGSGFYNTDYGTRKRLREQAENAKSEKSEGSSDSSASDSDAKPSKSDAKPKDKGESTAKSKVGAGKSD